MKGGTARVAIVDYDVGNLFSVRQACEAVSLDAEITASPDAILNADAVILPGVGAFGDAMERLGQLGLVPVLKQVAGSGRPLVGICLGVQLLMDESEEFGRHAGLGLIRGGVRRFPDRVDGSRVKVPQVGWNRINLRPATHGTGWSDPSFNGLSDGEHMYFVHSYYVQPSAPSTITATATYAGIEFCAALRDRNIIGWQFHPERSARAGLHMYGRLAGLIRQGMETRAHA